MRNWRIGKLTIPLQGTSDVRLDPQLNKKVWEAGIKGVPYQTARPNLEKAK